MEEDVELGYRCKENAEEIPLETILSGISPHYLFDMLNVLKEYMVHDRSKAENTINVLAQTMRSGVQTLKKGKAYTPISNELKYVRLYLELAQLHYGDIEYVILNNSEDFSVPVFTIRHMAEDAFIRCLTAKPRFRKLRVYTFSDSTHDYIEIKDNGELLSKEEIKQLKTPEAEAIRNDYLLYEKFGWKVEIKSLPDEGNSVFLSHPRKK